MNPVPPELHQYVSDLFVGSALASVRVFWNGWVLEFHRQDFGRVVLEANLVRSSQDRNVADALGERFRCVDPRRTPGPAAILARSLDTEIQSVAIGATGELTMCFGEHDVVAATDDDLAEWHWRVGPSYSAPWDEMYVACERRGEIVRLGKTQQVAWTAIGPSTAADEPLTPSFVQLVTDVERRAGEAVEVDRTTRLWRSPAHIDLALVLWFRAGKVHVRCGALKFTESLITGPRGAEAVYPPLKVAIEILRENWVLAEPMLRTARAPSEPPWEQPMPELGRFLPRRGLQDALSRATTEPPTRYRIRSWLGTFDTTALSNRIGDVVPED